MGTVDWIFHNFRKTDSFFENFDRPDFGCQKEGTVPINRLINYIKPPPYKLDTYKLGLLKII